MPPTTCGHQWPGQGPAGAGAVRSHAFATGLSAWPCPTPQLRKAGLELLQEGRPSSSLGDLRQGPGTGRPGAGTHARSWAGQVNCRHVGMLARCRGPGSDTRGTPGPLASPARPWAVLSLDTGLERKGQGRWLAPLPLGPRSLGSAHWAGSQHIPGSLQVAGRNRVGLDFIPKGGTANAWEAADPKSV